MSHAERTLRDASNVERFPSAEDAWFWACAAMVARRDGHRRDHTPVRRNCDPDDILLCIERLLQTGRLADAHARVLGKWGVLGWRPSAAGPEAEAALLWRNAMEIVDLALARKGILAKH